MEMKVTKKTQTGTNKKDERAGEISMWRGRERDEGEGSGVRKDTGTTEIYTLARNEGLPIWRSVQTIGEVGIRPLERRLLPPGLCPLLPTRIQLADLLQAS